MKMIHTKKFRHGSVSLGLTVVVIAAVILFNAVFSVFAERNQWYIDMTPEPVFTLSDRAKELLTAVDPESDVTILFCDEKDAWQAETAQLEVLKTALDMSLEFENIHVEYVDIFTNPSAVADYRVRTGKNIDSTSVIITSGTEVRVYNLEKFFAIDSDTSEVTGYDGEYVFVSAILAVTRAESPVLCVTTNHGELQIDSALISLMESVGFKIQPLDLASEEIPADCRLLMIFDPQTDFLEKDGVMTDISEIDKLDKFLDDQNSLMVFFDTDTPALPNLETLLSEWGIKIARTDDTAHIIEDMDSSLSVNGFSNKAVYETGGTGADITAQLRRETYYPTVAFPMTTALEFSPLYTIREHKNGYQYAQYSISTGINRLCYKVFSSSSTARALADGEEVRNAADDGAFTYMTLTIQEKSDVDNNTTLRSFVLASGSTQFASEAALNTKYANHAVISYACNNMGSLAIPVDLDCKYFANMEITTMTAKAANQFTAVLTIVPTSLVFIAGIYVMVRRKYA